MGCAREKQAGATWVPPLLAGRWFLPIFTGGFTSGPSVASANCRRGRGPLRGQGASRSGPPTPIRPWSCVSTSPRLQAQRWVCLPHPPCGHLRKPRAPPLEQASPQPGPLWSVPIWKAPPPCPLQAQEPVLPVEDLPGRALGAKTPQGCAEPGGHPLLRVSERELEEWAPRALYEERTFGGGVGEVARGRHLRLGGRACSLSSVWPGPEGTERWPEAPSRKKGPVCGPRACCAEAPWGGAQCRECPQPCPSPHPALRLREQWLHPRGPGEGSPAGAHPGGCPCRVPRAGSPAGPEGGGPLAPPGSAGVTALPPLMLLEGGRAGPRALGVWGRRVPRLRAP